MIVIKLCWSVILSCSVKFFRQVKLRHTFQIDAMVVLPEHLHAIWTLSEGDPYLSKRWGLIKANFSRGLAKNESLSKSCMLKGRGESDSEDIGSILFTMKRTIAGMWITSILIRLSMVWLSGVQSGHIPAFIVMLPEVYYRLIGGIRQWVFRRMGLVSKIF